MSGRSLGLQFHPEVTTEIMDDWVRVYRHELDAEGVDPDALLAETDRNAEESRRIALQLLERFLDGVARLGSARDPAMIRDRRLGTCSPASSTCRTRTSSAARASG